MGRESGRESFYKRVREEISQGRWIEGRGTDVVHAIWVINLSRRIDHKIAKELGMECWRQSD